MNQPQKQKTQGREYRNREGLLWFGIGFALIVIVGAIVGLLLHTPNVDEIPNFPTDGGTTESEDVGASAEPYTRKEGYYTFLVAGVDDVSMSTDVMMLISLDTVNNKLNVVQLPRDTFVNSAVGGFTTVHRVNAVFTGEYNRRVNKGTSAKTAEGQAMEALCDHLERTLCLTIDEYLLVKTSSFCAIVDAVGGIDFEVPFDMFYEDPEQDLYIDLKAGYQHLDGKQCEQLIRYRDGYSRGDIERMEMRAAFMSALFSQVKDRIGVETLVELLKQDRTLFTKTCTSMSFNDAISYIRMVYKVKNGDMDVRTISGAVVQSPDSGLWLYFCLNKKGALADINECLNVYTTDIRPEHFDVPGFFTDTANAYNAYIHEYYSSDM
ncbi:MAG: LCP family protein [Clostridia bacterium]|nr:LCP family protein [Clostridia bacterium]